MSWWIICACISHRVLRHCHSFTVEPSVVVRATALQSCRAHQSAATTALDNSILVSVYVENVSVVSRVVNIYVKCVKHVSV